MNETTNASMMSVEGMKDLFAGLGLLVPTYTHLLLSALFPIFAGAHASLSRPSTAAKPDKKKSKSRGDSLDDDEDDEPLVQRMEGMNPSDAIAFPILAGITLTSLYFLIKWLEDPAILNKILNWYFASFSVIGVGRMVSDGLDVMHSLAFPKRYHDNYGSWTVRTVERRAVCIDETETPRAARNTPLPGPFALLRLPKLVLDALWFLKAAPNRKFTFKIRLPRAISAELKLGIHGIEGLTIGLITVFYYNFISKPWPLTNLLGFSFAYGAMQLLSPTTFATGTLLLAALFIYDIYMVFYTPMMVSVAKSLEIPAKLEFPRPDEEGRPALAMLGLGDVVLPGIFCGLALRFDLWMHYLRLQRPQAKSAETTNQNTSQNSTLNDTAERRKDGDFLKAKYTNATGAWGDRFWTSSLALLLAQLSYGDRRSNGAETDTRRTSSSSHNQSDSKVVATPRPDPAWAFPRTYFKATLVGYVIGMVVTLVAMQISNHPQPALLYLVPGVVGALWASAWARGEVGLAWEFSEGDEEEGDDKEKKDEKSEAKQRDTRDRAQTWWDALAAYAGIGQNKSQQRNKQNNDQKSTDSAASKSAKEGENDKDSSGVQTEQEQGQSEEVDDSRPWIKLSIPRVFVFEVRLPSRLPEPREVEKKTT